MKQRAQRSTLFPYTTLFRSDRVTADEHAPRRRQRRARLAQPVDAPEESPRVARRGRDAEPRGAARMRDRKSTRLNSSHVKISYAVFCLKKKKHESESGISLM